MRRFEEHNPIAVAAYFLCAASATMLSMDPVILTLSLLGALALHLHLCGPSLKTHLYSLALFLVMALVNPLVSHHGVTVLFVMNHNPITLEATLYGLAAAGMILAVLYWFLCFSRIMTSDRLLYLFGALSPKVALILSMALRYVPLFHQQAAKTQQAQKTLGLDSGEGLMDRARGGLHVFSALMTWALENGVTTADSMAARGYGIGKRSRFAIFRFTWRDTLLLLLSLLLTVGTLCNLRSFTYYPTISTIPMNARHLAGFISYAALVLLPLLIDGKEALRWRCLQSRI